MTQGLRPGTYTVTELASDEYVPQAAQTLTVVADRTATVTFSNTLKRGTLEIVKNSEDGLAEGVRFHLYGTSLKGDYIDLYAVTDVGGIARFENILISGETPYTVEEVDTAVRYVIPEAQDAPIEWAKVTRNVFENHLKKWRVTVTKVDVETTTAQGGAKLAGAVYGIYENGELVDTYTTDENGQFTSDYYVCGDNWTLREISPSEGYLLDDTVHHIGAENTLYEVEYNDTENRADEQVMYGNIAVIKHTDNGDTQIETPEVGAKFEIFLKAAGSYANAKESERDVIVCDELGFCETKMLPYGVYTVHQTEGWDGSEKIADFDVFICEDGKTYNFLINNRQFESYIRVMKIDAETGKPIPVAGVGFKLYDPNGEQIKMTYTYPTVTTVDTFYTNENGYLVTPEKLPFGRGYSVVEVSAPYGYVLDTTPVYFDVTEDNAEREDLLIVIEVEKADVPQKGTVTLTKTGEVFVSVIEADGVYVPVYEVRPLAGAVYEIVAADDIYTPDGTLRYAAGSGCNMYQIYVVYT